MLPLNNFSLTYDLSNRLSENVDANGNSIKYGLDYNNNVQSIAENISGNSYVSGCIYDVITRLEKLIYPVTFYPANCISNFPCIISSVCMKCFSYLICGYCFHCSFLKSL
ncbi:MAG: hypothetical protein N2448_00995 [Caloramator sp.]|nr:hypothetical protein [Caloramator sp.]